MEYHNELLWLERMDHHINHRSRLLKRQWHVPNPEYYLHFEVIDPELLVHAEIAN